MKKIAIIGAGSCGTSLAIALAQSPKQHRIRLWVHGQNVLQSLQTRRENSVYLPGFRLADTIDVTGDLAEALADADIVLGAMPSSHARAVYSSVAEHLSHPVHHSGPIFVSATKGLEHNALARMSQVISQSVCPRVPAARIAVLSGPSFAREIAAGDPTAVVIASMDTAVASEIQEQFSGPFFRLYTNSDVAGVEICGAAKNVIAIAAGVCTGLGLGTNAVAALITRGLAEMARLCVAVGGRRDTPSGLAGLGDLVLTATGSLSRNRAVGIELGKGRPLVEILAGMRMVAEGVPTAASLLALAHRHSVETPIVEQVNAVLHHGRSPQQAIRELMDRPLKRE
jgi:glycerol-3-phosphate dehydrogenase (NAD(P)+)